MSRTPLPVFFKVTVCVALVVRVGWFPNETLAGERLTTGAAPVPVRLTLWGLPEALSEMLRVPLRVPVALGVKVTLIVQLTPAATEPPQLLV
jgi:hypothetical protein